MSSSLKTIVLLALLSLGLVLVTPVPPVSAGDTCCAIVAIDQAKGTVTLRDLKTSQTFQVAVKDAARLKSLKIGQAVDRNIGTPVR